ncbi:hypothetical protein ACGFNU_44655 [Spirillospora sp. NPDC048911]|uniref:DUF7144 family membrane protein n=1 Tax=Spirillospora sp. NPDC048911 TaxID=3364527 RepID=UPI0037129EA2
MSEQQHRETRSPEAQQERQPGEWPRPGKEAGSEKEARPSEAAQSTISARLAGGSGARDAWVTGLALFAAVTMFVAGVFQALEGLAAIINDKYYVTTPNYIFEYDVTAYGWVHLLVGAVLAVAGYGTFAGHLWGRVIGIIVAVLSAVANFMFIPYHPVWAMLIITLNVAVIWALCVYSHVSSVPARRSSAVRLP